MNCINIKDSFIFNDTAKKNYSEYGKFDDTFEIADMSLIFMFTHDPYLVYIKTIFNSKMAIYPRSHHDFTKKLKNIVVDSILINMVNQMLISMIYLRSVLG
jgi:hypothetical protein